MSLIEVEAQQTEYTAIGKEKWMLKASNYSLQVRQSQIIIWTPELELNFWEGDWNKKNAENVKGKS